MNRNGAGPDLIGPLLMLLSLLLIFPGLFLEPFLLVRPFPAPAPALYEVILIDLVHGAVVLAVFGLGLAIHKAAMRSPADSASEIAKAIPAIRPRVRDLALRAAGRATVTLGVFGAALGLQESMLNVDHSGSSLGDLGVSACGILVVVVGVVTVTAANRSARFAAMGAGRAVPSVGRRIRSWCFRVCGWLVRLVGGALALLSALSALTLVIRPGQRGLAFCLAVFIDLAFVGIGVLLFRLGLAAKRAAKRSSGLATPIDARAALPKPRRALIGILSITGATLLPVGATLILCGPRMALSDVTTHRPLGLREASPYLPVLTNLAIAALGLAAFWAGRRMRNAARRRRRLVAPVVPLPKQRRIRGWAFRVASWTMRVAGSVVMIIGFVGMAMTTRLARLFGAPWYVFATACVVLNVGGLIILRLSSIPAMLAGRYLATVLASAADLSPGSYVLYLRPFSQDRAMAANIPHRQKLNTWLNPFLSMMQSDRAHEERLSAVFAEFGPLVAVGSPGEQVPGGAGALRVFLPVDGWQETVGELIDSARLIVLGTGPGPGTLWEYVEVLRRRHPSRLVLLVSDPIEYKRFKASSIAEVEGVLFELQRRYGDLWEAPILPDLPHYQTTPEDRAFWLRAMIYFSNDWEPHLISLNTSGVFGNFRFDNARIREVLYPLIAHVRTGAG